MVCDVFISIQIKELGIGGSGMWGGADEGGLEESCCQGQTVNVIVSCLTLIDEISLLSVYLPEHCPVCVCEHFGCFKGHLHEAIKTCEKNILVVTRGRGGRPPEASDRLIPDNLLSDSSLNHQINYILDKKKNINYRSVTSPDSSYLSG